MTARPRHIPRRLWSILRRNGYNQRATARELQINPSYLNKLTKHGIEPTNPAIRAKLSLPRKRRRRAENPPPQALPLADHLRWWRRLRRQTRERYILHLFTTSQEKLL